MSAETRLETVAYCAECNEGMDWHGDEAEEWAEQHNKECHS